MILSIRTGFSTSSPHFDPAVQRTQTEPGLITEHDLPPYIQVLLPMLPTPVRSALTVNGSDFRLPGSLMSSRIGRVLSVPDRLIQEPSTITACKPWLQISGRQPPFPQWCKVRVMNRSSCPLGFDITSFTDLVDCVYRFLFYCGTFSKRHEKGKKEQPCAFLHKYC